LLVPNPVLITEKEIRDLARRARGGIRRIYLHWTAGHYGQVYDEYHLSVDRDGQVYGTCRNLTDYKGHTYMHNSGAVGLTLCCGAGARCWLPDGCEGYEVEQACQNAPCAPPDCALIDYGPEPPTGKQVEVMAKVVAALADELCLPVSRASVQTHCEVAFDECYGPGDGDPDMRWDLWFLPDPDKGGALVPGGELLRGKALFYQDRAERDCAGPFDPWEGDETEENGEGGEIVWQQ